MKTGKVFNALATKYKQMPQSIGVIFSQVRTQTDARVTGLECDFVRQNVAVKHQKGMNANEQMPRAFQRVGSDIRCVAGSPEAR